MSISQQNSRLPPNLRGREMRGEISSLILLNERANLLKIIKDRDNNINKRKELQDEHEEILKRLMGNIKQKKVARAKGRGGIRKSRAQEKRETERGIRGEKRTPGTDEPVIIGEQIKRTDGGLQITYQDPAESARIQRERAQDLARLENIRLEDNRLRGEREREDRNLRREELQFNRERLERDERRHQDLLQLRDRELLAKTTSIQSNPIVPDEDIPLEKTQSELERVASLESQLSRAGELLDPSLPPQTSAASLATSGNAPQAESIVAPSVVGDPALTVEETTPEDRRQEFLNLQPGGGSVFGGEELPAVGEEEAELTVEITDQPTDPLEGYLEAQRSSSVDKPTTVAEVFTENPITSEELSSGIRRPPSPRQPATGRDYEDDLRLLGRAGLPIGEPGSAERLEFENKLGTGEYRGTLTTLQEIEDSEPDPDKAFENLKRLLGNVDATKELADQSIERKLKTIEANAAMTSGPDDSLEKQKKANAEYIKKEDERERERARIAQEEGKRLIEKRKIFTPPPPLPTQPGLTLNLSKSVDSDVAGLPSIKSREPPAPRPRSKLPDELAEGLGITTSRLDPTRSSGESRGRRGGISVDKLEGITLGESIEPEVELAIEPEVPIEPEVEEAEVAEPDVEESGKKLSRREKIPDLLERLDDVIHDARKTKLLKAVRDFQRSKLAQETDDSGSGQKLADYLEEADEDVNTDFEKVIEVILKGHKKDWDDKKKFNAFYDRIDKIIIEMTAEIDGASSSSSSSSDSDSSTGIYSEPSTPDPIGDIIRKGEITIDDQDYFFDRQLNPNNGNETIFLFDKTTNELVGEYGEDNYFGRGGYIEPIETSATGGDLVLEDDGPSMIFKGISMYQFDEDDDPGTQAGNLVDEMGIDLDDGDGEYGDAVRSAFKELEDNGFEPALLRPMDYSGHSEANQYHRSKAAYALRESDEKTAFEVFDTGMKRGDTVMPSVSTFKKLGIHKNPSAGEFGSRYYNLAMIVDDDGNEIRSHLKEPTVEEPSVEEPSVEESPPVEDDLGSPLSPDTLRDLAKGAPQPPIKAPEVVKKSPAYRYVDRDVESPPVKKKSKPIPATIGVSGGVQRSTSGGSMIGPRADGTKGGYTDGNIIKLLELRDEIKLSKSKKKEMKDRIKKLRQEDSLMSVTEAIDELRKLL